MSRPIDRSRYISGPACRLCGSTLRHRNNSCVGCTKRRNAAKYALRRDDDDDAPPSSAPMIATRGGKTFTAWSSKTATRITTQQKLTAALSYYTNSPKALERSRRLDALTLGKPLDQDAAPLTGGDLHRASLPVGYSRAVTQSRDEGSAKRAELAPLVAAVTVIYDRLPDLVTIWDVLDRLDPMLVVETAKARSPIAVAKTIKKLGGVPREAGNCGDRTHVRLYVLRNADRYAALRGRGLYATYQSLKAAAAARMVNGRNRPAAASRRSSKARNRPDTPDRRMASQWPSAGDCGGRAKRPLNPPFAGRKSEHFHIVNGDFSE